MLWAKNWAGKGPGRNRQVTHSINCFPPLEEARMGGWGRVPPNGKNIPPNIYGNFFLPLLPRQKLLLVSNAVEKCFLPRQFCRGHIFFAVRGKKGGVGEFNKNMPPFSLLPVKNSVGTWIPCVEQNYRYVSCNYMCISVIFITDATRNKILNLKNSDCRSQWDRRKSTGWWYSQKSSGTVKPLILFY